MSAWSEFRNTIGLPKGKTPWAAVWTVLVLVTAGWLLQERATAPSMNDLDYSELYRLIDEGKVERMVIKGQAVEGDFFEPQKIAGHRTNLFRATAPINDPSFWPLLHDKKVSVRVVAVGPGLLTRVVSRGATAGAVLGVRALGLASHEQCERECWRHIARRKCPRRL